MGKLFGRDRKVSGEETSNAVAGDLNDFFHGSGDKLEVAHAEPPVLAKLDITSATRYPQGADLDGRGNAQHQYHHQQQMQQHLRQPQQQALSYRPKSTSRRRAKGLSVRFTDNYPEIMGIGGDECSIPTVEISKAKKMRPPPVTATTGPPRPNDIPDKQPSRAFPETSRGGEDHFTPPPFRRTQTGYSSISDSRPEPQAPAERDIPPDYPASRGIEKHERRKSIIEVQEAQMRRAEGQAFARAARSASESTHQDGLDWRPSPVKSDAAPSGSPEYDMPSSLQASHSRPSPVPPPHQPPPYSMHPPPPQAPQVSPSQHSQTAASSYVPDSPENRSRMPQGLEQSPASVYSQTSGWSQPYAMYRQGSRHADREAESPSVQQKGAPNLHDVVVAAGEDAMETFAYRTRHLFELFRLHSETVRPILSCPLEDLARAGVWWFLRGRMALENAVRERPADPDAQRRNENARQQAYADLAKGYWLSEEIIPEVLREKRIPSNPEVDDARQNIASSLRKLAVSMKRNGFLPPEEALLPAHLERSIWLEYPSLTQDIVYLLWGAASAGLSQLQQPTSGLGILETLPLGDTTSTFCFGRVNADVFLMEQGMESQRLRFPCLLSITRPQQQPDITFVLASQNGAIQLRISGNKKLGPVWDDLKWRSDSCTLEIRLPRGFILVVRCSQQDYRMLWSMYDFSSKVQSTLYPRKDEQCVFRTTLRTFQYFDNDPQSRQFPRDPVSKCELALFEKILREGAATGPRSYHRGFRVAIVTGPRTKTLSGVNQTYTPQMLVQFGFLRGESNDPALAVSFENGKLKGSMVMSFQDEKERLRMHGLLVGTALRNDEQIYCEVPTQGIWFSERFDDTKSKPLAVLSSLSWTKARVINEDSTGDRPACVLADKLRVIFEFKDGTVTDRINVAPGELKMRLNVNNLNCLMLFRQPQQDLTLAVTEAKGARDKNAMLSQALEHMSQSPTIRTYMFPSLEDLHNFETAITGFKVLYDGVAVAFAIARRRMVVPIHKKWEAGSTRIQVVQQDGVTQLLAFFEDFTHGQCMGFALKGTDVFETFSRSGKAGLKIDDAKFPLPKPSSGEMDNPQAMAEAAFVCLDLPELPGEHDDISILFDSEAGTFRFPLDPSR
jgi:hypothetical protein